MSGARYQTNNKEAEYFLTHTAVGSLDIFIPHPYQSKEFMDDFGFYLQDFDARMFDSQLGRWHAIDPVMQFASPYVGMGNNPVSLTDPDGMSVPDDDVPPGWIPSCDEVEIIGHLDHEGGIPFIGYELDYYSGGSYNPFDGQNSGVSHGSGGNAGGQGGNGVGNSVTTDSEAPSPRTPEEMMQDDVTDLISTIGEFATEVDLLIDATGATLMYTRLGSNIGQILSASKPLITIANDIPLLSNATTLVSTTADLYLSSVGSQSWAETSLNGAVNVTAIAVGGWWGVLIQLDYQMAKAYTQMLRKHPDWAMPPGFYR